MSYVSEITIGEGNNVDGTRYLGGSDRGASDHPFVKGYFYVFFGVPSKIFEGDVASARDYLLVSAEGFTPPGDRQINLQDIQGQGGVDSSFITGQTISREFSIAYRDYWGAPIFRVHRKWTSFIDPYLGGSEIAEVFSGAEYKGICMVIQTKPVARKGSSFTEQDIIKVDLFDGVQPQTDLKSAYDANITDNSFVKPTVQYKFDGMPMDETVPGVLTKALEVLNSKDMFEKNVESYNKLLEGKNLN